MSQKITSRQMKAILALAAGKDVLKAAEEAGVERETVSRWKQQPLFRAELSRIETETTADATRRLASLLNKSVDELNSLLNTILPPADKLRVIRVILASYPRMAEITRIDLRLSELEELIKNGIQNGNK